MDTCKITKQLAQTFQSKFSHHDRLISLKCLALFDEQIYPNLREQIFTTCLNAQDLSSQLTSLRVLPFMQYHLPTSSSFLPIFYAKYSTRQIDDRLKSAVIECWRMHRCLFETDTVLLQVSLVSSREEKLRALVFVRFTSISITTSSILSDWSALHVHRLTNSRFTRVVDR